jgi:group I intron endonuclease
MKDYSMVICKALIKYGHANFSLEILEYCSPEDLIKREQYYLDRLKPEYNISLTAGAPMTGRNHSELTKVKISEGHKGKILLEETKAKMAAAALGRQHHEETIGKMRAAKLGKTHTEETRAKLRAAALNREKPAVPGIRVEITDLQTKLTTTYDSIRKAADAINSDIKTILNREKSQLTKGINTPYRGRYMIVIKRP